MPPEFQKEFDESKHRLLIRKSDYNFVYETGERIFSLDALPKMEMDRVRSDTELVAIKVSNGCVFPLLFLINLNDLVTVLHLRFQTWNRSKKHPIVPWTHD